MTTTKPLYIFDSAEEYYRRHHAGVLREFENESKEVIAFNQKEAKYRAWVLAKDYETKSHTYWILIVRPGEHGAEFLFPREGESCEIQFWTKSGNDKKWKKRWEAERIENPAALFGIPEGEAHHLPSFKVKVPNEVPKDIIIPLEGDPDEVGYTAKSRLTGKFGLGDKKAIRVSFQLRMSSATKDAETGALNKLFKNPEGALTDKQKAAFNYLLSFKEVPFQVNMFNHFPHLRDPLNNPGRMPEAIVTLLKGFNDHQRAAYKAVLSSLPCGIGIIPGGPGAGKTHWNLVVTAAIQCKDILYYRPDVCVNQSAKVLYLLDINKPLDDTCNKIVKLYRRLGLKKRAVRLYGWHYNSKNGIPDFSKKFLFVCRMNRYRRTASNKGCLAPTLDELAWDIYQAGKTTKYSKLHQQMNLQLNGKREVDDTDSLKSAINHLYLDVLDSVDFIATTPVPASTGFDGLYNPDIIIFDESPHAREASTLVAIAQYDPIAWIFSGDHRQTRPFVASDDVRSNPWAPQMLVSMMERADHAGAISHSLLINHRAYGGLQQLASTMFYNGKMVSGYKENETTPPNVQYLQKYLERFLPVGQSCHEPRLIVYDAKNAETKIGTSWFNPSHIEWVMNRVQELLPDSKFQQVGKRERGTILIISPYKESYHRYKKAIKALPPQWQARLNVEGRCEARTIDTVQGGEADFVFLDMVRSVATDFTDDPNRLNVALTRARQAEIVLMHPGMRRYTSHLNRIFSHVASLGQVIEINKPQTAPAQISTVQVDHREELGQTTKTVVFDSQPPSEHTKDGNWEIAHNSSKANDGGPQSIFADTFSGLTDLMQDILDKKKSKHAKARTQQTLPHGVGNQATLLVDHSAKLHKQSAMANTRESKFIESLTTTSNENTHLTAGNLAVHRPAELITSPADREAKNFSGPMTEPEPTPLQCEFSWW